MLLNVLPVGPRPQLDAEELRFGRPVVNRAADPQRTLRPDEFMVEVYKTGHGAGLEIECARGMLLVANLKPHGPIQVARGNGAHRSLNPVVCVRRLGGCRDGGSCGLSGRARLRVQVAITIACGSCGPTSFRVVRCGVWVSDGFFLLTGFAPLVVSFA